jgi:hypothetical protein
LKKFILYSFLSFSVISLCIGIFTSCNKNEEIGINVQPEGDILGVSFISSIPILAHTVLEDSVRSDETVYNLVGSYMDPVFGLTTAGCYTQFRLTTSNVDFGLNPVCDSIVLSLLYKSYYGDTSSYLTLNVYEIADDFYLDNTYYSNQKLGVFKNNLANITFKPNFVDSVTVDSASYAPHLRIKLKKTLGDKIIAASSSSDLADNSSFLKFFKGLYISTNSVSSSGAIIYFNLLSSLSKITLYYHSDNGLFNYSMVIDDYCARYNYFDHYYSSADVLFKNQINGDTTLGNDFLYLQAMAGTKIKFKFPDITSLNSLGRIAVNKAELVMKVDETNIDTYPPPANLTLVLINTDGSLSFLPDYNYGSAYFGGIYNSTNKEYRFNIGKYIQDVLQRGYINDNGLFLVVSGASIYANRAVILGNNSAENNFRLEITYTKID